ncbi:MAG: response regulator [Rhodospirillales bacterium]
MAKILVVDDVENVRYSLRLVLENAGHEVFEAENGIYAENLLRDHAFDLVITDIIMPDKEGMELIMDINEMYPATKVIAITGGGRTNSPVALRGSEEIMGIEASGPSQIYLEAAGMLGAHDTLIKPFDTARLMASVDQCLALDQNA